MGGNIAQRPPPFANQSIIDAKNRTFNWPFLFAMIPETNRMHEVANVPEAATEPQRELATSHRGQLVRPVPKIDFCGAEEVVLYTGNEDGTYMESSGKGMSDYHDPGETHSDPQGRGRQNQSRNGISVHDVDDEDAYAEDGADNDSEYSSSSELDSDYDSDEEFDDIDEDEAHIENLVAISGSASKHYDTERWLRTLLWTLHMYVDGYCSDYSFTYGKRYAPSCAALRSFIRDHGGDPFAVQAPVSNAPALLPHQAAMAMLPKRAAALLPTPLQDIVNDPQASKKIFLPGDEINVALMLRAIELVPLSAYSDNELERTRFGQPFLIRRLRNRDRAPAANPDIEPPGELFSPVRQFPVLFSTTFPMTTSPPCHPWPTGGVPRLLTLPYKHVGSNESREWQVLRDGTYEPAQKRQHSPARPWRGNGSRRFVAQPARSKGVKRLQKSGANDAKS